MSAHAGPLSLCDYCGLPLSGPWWRARGEDQQPPAAPAFCCFGCRFAAAVSQSGGEQGAANWMLARLGTAIFLSMNVMVFTMALWSQHFYGDDLGASAWVVSLRGLFRYLSLLFALPVLLLLGSPLLEEGWASLKRGALTTDLLLILGVAASYFYSAISVIRDQGPVYFEVGCTVLVLVTLGRWLEATGKMRTTAAIEALHRLLPDRVRVLRDNCEVSLPRAEIVPGDCLRVLAGERIPCDGRVMARIAAVDEQVVTGESHPLVKEPGDLVYGGSLDLDGELLIEATVAGTGGTLARMVELVRQAGLAKGRFQRLADRATTVFLPLFVAVAVGTLAWHTWNTGFQEGILAGLAVLVIACPCALGLATPMAVWAALGQAARSQVLFRNPDALERLAGVRAVRFDKTGTLTTGHVEVAEFSAATEAERPTVLALAAGLAAASTHGYSIAITRYAEQQKEMALSNGFHPLQEVRALAGRGLVARTENDSRSIYLGSLRFMAEAGLALGQRLGGVAAEANAAGRPIACMGWEDSVRGLFVFRERLRPEAVEAIGTLRKRRLDVAVLTGDSAARSSELSEALGVPVAAGLLPEDKVQAVSEARRLFGPVAMVGDGINDAPALAASDVGIAMGCGTDVSRASAAVCLLGNDLLHLPWTIDLAVRTVRILKQNLFWAFAYNLAGIGFACTGRLNPIVAALAMFLSSFLVVTNSLRLSGGSDRVLRTDSYLRANNVQVEGPLS